MFKLILKSMASWAITSSILYFAMALLGSFIHLENLFDISEWERYSRAFLGLLSLFLLVVCFIVEKEVENV